MIFEYNLCEHRYKKSIQAVSIILGSLFGIVDLMIFLGSIAFFVEGKNSAGILLLIVVLFFAIVFVLPLFVLVFSYKNVRFQVYETKYRYINFRKKQFIIEREGTRLCKGILGKGFYYSIKKENKTLLRIFSLPNDEKFENGLKSIGIDVEK